MLSPASPQLPIAIVGIAAQLPGGTSHPDNLDHKQFFDFLLNKGRAYEKIPADRFNIDSYHGHDAGQVATQHGTFLKGTDMIDHVELGITSKDARSMSLSTRKLIDLSFLALLDSGIDYRGKNVGCFASGIVFDVLSLSHPDEFEARGSFGGPPAMIANRVSYHLDLTGPSVPVDTACSSSLTATHLAVQAIRAQDCDAAVVGGVQLNHRFVDWVQYSQGGILAPDGMCKPFDASANGFSRGEAGVAIVLKRLDQALKDKDHIYATILGSGINSAGSAAPVNAPVGAAQRDAMRRAWSQTGRAPSEVDFVELHATGTAAGDPVEANWVGDAFRRDDQLLIGSVKGNIGHTEIAAFLASLTKVINIFRTGSIPPNVNFSVPNQAIKWDEYRLHVPTEAVPLPRRASSGRALVALCSSGIGGSNGHVVVESPPIPSPAYHHHTPNSAKSLLLVAGGLSPRTATAISDAIAELVATHPDRLPLISTVYGRRARQMTWRSYATYTPGQQQQLKFSAPTLAPRVKPPVAFVFAGQGPQHLDMGRELFDTYPVFRESILEMDDVHRAMTGVSLISSTGIFSKRDGPASSAGLGEVWPITVTLPALAMLQCALVDLLASLGVRPDVVVGHSAGETAVFYASGAGTKAMVVELAVARGRAMALVESAGGSMAAVSCGIAKAEALLAEAGVASEVDIACHNSEEAVTIAGPVEALDAVVALAESRGIMARKLRTRVPVHSRMMELCRERYVREVEKVWADHPGERVPQVPVYSTLTGARFGGPFTSEYFWRGTRGAVLFTEAVGELLADNPTTTCVELSPHPVLASYLSALGATNVISPLRRPKRNERGAVEVPALLDGLGRLSALGHNSVDFAALNNDPVLDGDFPFPAYPFNPKPVPYHAESPAFYRQFQGRKGPLNYPGLRVNAQTHPVLAQHVIKGEPIMPAAGFIEMALEFGAMVLWDVEFRSMMSLSAERPTPVQVALDGIHWTVKTSTASAATNKNDAVFDKLHAQGYLSLDAPRNDLESVDLEDIQMRCKRIDLTNFYEDLKTFAEYGPAFQRVVDGYQGENEVLVLVRGPDDLLDIEGYCFHPAILDCCLHFMVHKSFTLSTDNNVYYLPSRVGRLVVHSALVDFAFPDHVYAHIVFKSWTPSTILADFHIVAIDGTRLCTLTEVEVERHESSPSVAVAQRYDVAFQPVAVPVSAGGEKELVAAVVAGSDVDMNGLHAYLDYLASGVIRSTLGKRPVTGPELDRVRYRDFAAEVAASPVSAEKFDAATIREIERKWPEMIEITQRLSSVHAKIFETSKAAVEVLYKDDIMTRFYKHYDWASKACAARFRTLLSSLVQSGKHVIRVLEVGSGTGALTRHLADVMSDFPSAVVEFVVSDVSKELLPRMSYPRCRYRSFDISKPAESQGFEPSSFDIITGFDVLHVVPEMAPSLAELNGLLVPGGSLLIGDLNGNSWETRAPGAIWFDFVFGSFAEWFSYTDGRSHCSMSSRQWHRCLDSAGFGNVVTAAFAADPLLFTLEAQKIQQNAPLRSLNVDKIIFPYRRGTEGELRAQVNVRDASAPLSLWLFSAAGFDGDAGVGLSRSLGKEYPRWDVHFVVFDGTTWNESSQRGFVSSLADVQNSEALLHVDAAGKVYVPRVVPSQAPTLRRPFQPSLPWIASGSEVVQTSTPMHTEGSVIVEVLAMSPPELGFRGFVGRVLSTAADDRLQAANLVAGVHSSPGFSNIIAVHQDSVTSLPPSAEAAAADIAGSVLGITIGSLACGTSLLHSARRLRGRKALLSHVGPVVGPSLKWFFALLGVETVELKADSPADIAASGLRFDFILSGSDSREDHQGYARALARGGRAFVLNDARGGCGVATLLRDDPLAVGEALDASFERIAGRWPCNAVGVRVSDVPLPEAGTPVPSSMSLFDPTKAYILVGGIGGLGIRIALWMYERGARYIVLTSRSGRNTLSRVQDHLALRIVDYLESLKDLTIRLEASDATSHTSTAALLQSIPAPLGGCMLLSVVLSDRTFAFQDKADFDKVFASKTGACRVIEACVPNGISSLDFFVAFSSVVGLFGNGGQTNYSSANTALDGIMRGWDNAFTFVLPAISDGGGLASETREQGGRLGHLTPWGMPVQRICDCLEDGLRKLQDGPFWQYIPDLDWALVQKYMEAAPLYNHLVGSTTEEGPSHTADTGKSLQDTVIELLDVDPSEFSADVPFTAYGLDSLSAARLSLALRPHVAISQLQLLSDVSLSDLYARAEAAREEAQPPEPSQRLDKKPSEDPRVAQIEDMVLKYTRAFRKHVGTDVWSPTEGEVVLVTGTTGAIGTAMLARLVTMPSVARVYAFNRASTRGSPTLRERQAASLEARGYDPRILDEGKIVLIEGDQSVDDLGISSSLYQEIRDSVTSIIHNAWPVNFTASLATVEPAVRSVRTMVDLALGSPHQQPPRLLFLSSIGLFYDRIGTTAAPEERITDLTQVARTGYSESKLVGERILERAAEETALRPVIVRAGQICGGLNGSWSTTEWFPFLVKSSVHLGCLPKMEGDVSWVPLRGAADALIDMRNTEKQTLHISHPRPISGSVISESLSRILKLPVVPYAEWLARLQKSAEGSAHQEDLDANPALGLLDYFSSLEVGSNGSKEALGLPRLSVAEGVNASSALRDVESLTPGDAERWVEHWRKTDFLRI